MRPTVQYIVQRLTDRFWTLVELARTDWSGFQQALRDMPERDRWRLYWTYKAALSALRWPEYERFAAADLVEDGLYDLAAWIVAQGRSVYMDIIEHPEHMPLDAPDDAYPSGGAPLDAIVRAQPRDKVVPEDDDFYLR